MDLQNIKEQQAELQAEAKHYFIELKKWYNGLEEGSSLRKEHGAFPMFSRELAGWQAFKPVLKAYKATLHEAETKEAKEKAKKRKKRWGVVGTSTDNDGANGTKKKKKSRWGGEKDGALVSTASTLQGLTTQKTFLLRLQIDEINRKLLTVKYDAKIKENDPNRSPSPEPVYDSNGKRINTREVRMKKDLELEKQKLLEELVKLNPSLKPTGMKMSSLTRKIFIPVKDYPGYNFIGLIIGPRGNTQKRMEKDTNTKISIRGKGSQKEGKRGRTGPQEGMNEELHVFIQGNDEAGVEKAVAMIEELLRPVEDNLNEHKQAQLKELAMINGTLREDQYCSNCGQHGHRQWECPTEVPRSYKMANVTCAICGDGSHPTADCPQKNSNEDVEAKKNEIDNDYMDFMEELGEKVERPPEPVKAKATTVAPPAPPAKPPGPPVAAPAPPPTAPIPPRPAAAPPARPPASAQLSAPMPPPPRPPGLSAPPVQPQMPRPMMPMMPGMAGMPPPHVYQQWTPMMWAQYQQQQMYQQHMGMPPMYPPMPQAVPQPGQAPPPPPAPAPPPPPEPPAPPK